MVTAAQGREVARARRPAADTGSHVVAVARVVVGAAAAGGPRAPGEHAGAVAHRDLLGDAVGHLVAVDLDARSKVEHRLHDDLGIGVPAPRAYLVGGDQGLTPLELGDRIVAEDGRLGQVDVHHHLARLDRARRALGVAEVEGELPSRQIADGLGAAYVKRLLRPPHDELLGAGRDGGIEVEGVGDVELGLDPHGPGEGDQLVVDRDVALVPGFRGQPFELLRHEPADRLGDEPLELARAHLVGDRGDVAGRRRPPRRRRAGWSRARPGGPSTPAGHRRVTRLQSRGSRWRELDGLAQVALAGLGREPDRRRELGHAELRDRRSTRPRDGQVGLAEAAQPVGRLVRGSTRRDASPPTRPRGREGRPRPHRRRYAGPAQSATRTAGASGRASGVAVTVMSPSKHRPPTSNGRESPCPQGDPAS